MNATPLPNTAASSAAPPAPAQTDEARLAHLFRAARRAGRIHPLQHLLQRYRAEGGLAAAGDT